MILNFLTYLVLPTRCGHPAATWRPPGDHLAATWQPTARCGAATVRPIARVGCGHNSTRGAATVRPTTKIRAPSVRHIMVFGAVPVCLWCGKNDFLVRPRCGNNDFSVRPRCGNNDFSVRPWCGNNDVSVRFQCVIMIFGALPLRIRCVPPSGNVFPMKFTDTAMRKF